MLVSKIPLQSMGTGQDVAKMVVHLCSDAAGFITGSEFIMDGGLLLA